MNLEDQMILFLYHEMEIYITGIKGGIQSIVSYPNTLTLLTPSGSQVILVIILSVKQYFSRGLKINLSGHQIKEKKDFLFLL